MASHGFAGAIVSLMLALGIVLTGCAQQGPSGTPSAPSESLTPSVTSPPSSARSSTTTSTGGATAGGSTAPDGPQDPTQDRVRTGPVASFGGPAYGDQGIEMIGVGTWCDTVAVFWGGDTDIPAGVTFRFDRAVTSPASGLDVEAGICGTNGADRPCLGLVFPHDSTGVVCSMVLRPRAGFKDGTTITFVGTLTCPNRAVCDQMAARQVTPGPPIVVRIPADVLSPSTSSSPSDSPLADGSPSASASPTSGAPSTGDTSTGETSTGETSTGETSTGDASTGDTSTGSTGDVATPEG